MKQFQENQFSWFSQGLVYLVLLAAVLSVFYNLYHGVVMNPPAFVLVIVGFVMFLISKLIVISKGNLVSFGTIKMSNMVANFYRLGYWLMAVGVLFTFAGYKT